MVVKLEELGSQEPARPDDVETFWGYKSYLGPQKLEDIWVGGIGNWIFRSPP